MATQNDVRKIALSLPGTIEGTERFAFSVEVKGKQKGFVWVWLERKDPRKARTWLRAAARHGHREAEKLLKLHKGARLGASGSQV